MVSNYMEIRKINCYTVKHLLIGSLDVFERGRIQLKSRVYNYLVHT